MRSEKYVFLSYHVFDLNKYGTKTGSPDCIYCSGVPDHTEHTFFHCPRWERPRLEATRKLGVFSVDTVCANIMEDEGNWDCLSQFGRGILLEKKPDLDREPRSLDRAAG
ncbi:hypothetical protein J6590_025222 [Homalodisca vitripennis]|nr:hypothetical protein J6590_025222 [Homalodisca vitripennis]